MSARVALWLSLAAAVGCRNEVVKQQGGGALTCDSVISGLVVRLHPGAGGDAKLDEARSNYTAVLSNRCTEDKWTAEAMACIQAAPSEQEFQRCQDQHLSQEQRDKLGRATQAVAFAPSAEVPGARPAPKEAGGVGESLAMFTGFADKMCGCRDTPCADAVQAEFSRWAEDQVKNNHREEKPSEAKLKQLTQVGERYGECMAKAMDDRTGAAQPAGAVRLPYECDDYRMEVGTLSNCPKVPKKTRDALTQAYEQTAAAWVSVPPEGHAALGAACKAAADAVRQVSARCGASGLPKECLRYRAAILKLASCDKLPPETRDAIRESYEQAAAAWTSVPPERRADLATACTSAAEAVEQSAATCK